MRKLFFYLSIALLVGWSAIIWISFFGGIDTAEIEKSEAAAAGTGLAFVAMLFIWAIGVVPLGIIALIAKPR